MSPDFTLCLSLLSDSFAVGAALPPAPRDDDDSDDDDDEEDAPAAAKGGGPREPKGEFETVQRLKVLSTLLHARKFRAFWTLVNHASPAASGEEKEEQVRGLVEGLKASATGWDERVRDEVAREVERCFRSVKKETLVAFLGTEGASPLPSLPLCASCSLSSHSTPTPLDSTPPRTRHRPARPGTQLDPQQRRGAHPAEREQHAQGPGDARAHRD